MKNKKVQKEKKHNVWRDFQFVLKKIHIPWFWVILAFACNMLYNKVLLNLPTTTAGLLRGDLSKKVILDAVAFYAMYTIVLCLDTALRSPARHIAARNTRRVLWKQMMHTKMEYFDENNPQEAMSTITNDTTTAMTNLTSFLVAFIPDIYYVVMALKTISSYNVWLMVSVFMLLPLKLVYMIFIGKRNYKTQAGVFQEIGGLTAYLTERVRNLSLIKTYTNEKKELENGEKVAHKLFDANMKVAKLECLTTAFSTLIGLAQTLVIMVFGVVMLKEGEITMQQWVAFYMFAGTLSNSFSTIINYWINLKSIQGSLARAAKLLRAPVEENIVNEEITLNNNDIAFENVSFSYGEKQALKDVSFTVSQGTSTAIIGLCGSGKTTSISLLEHFYNPKSGTVKLGDVSVSDIPIEKLREKLGYVQQGAYIFSGTAREVLTYGIRREISDDEIWEAAKQAGLENLLKSWVDGLDTIVSSGGTSMSGGQRQRFVLTREFLRNTDILLLDEPTSALDAAASKTVQDTIFNMFTNKTKIIVTHDLSLIERVEQIIVLKNGELVGKGTYQELREKCKEFKELIYAQCSEKEVVE